VLRQTVTAHCAQRGVLEAKMPELMLLSNSFSAGRPALEHATDALAILFGGARRVLFVPYASSDPDGYTEATREDALSHSRPGK
jgi:peptidase E